MTKNDIIPKTTKELTLSEYSRIVGIPEDVLKGKKKSGSLSVIREVHWLLLLNAGHKYTDIARLYGRRHSSIIGGVKTARNLIETKDASIIPYMEMVDNFTRQEKTY